VEQKNSSENKSGISFTHCSKLLCELRDYCVLYGFRTTVPFDYVHKMYFNVNQ